MQKHITIKPQFMKRILQPLILNQHNVKQRRKEQTLQPLQKSSRTSSTESNRKGVRDVEISPMKESSFGESVNFEELLPKEYPLSVCNINAQALRMMVHKPAPYLRISQPQRKSKGKIFSKIPVIEPESPYIQVAAAYMKEHFPNSSVRRPRPHTQNSRIRRRLKSDTRTSTLRRRQLANYNLQSK